MQNALEELQIVSEDLLASTYDTFQDAAQRLADIISPPAPIGEFLDHELPHIDFEGWYASGESTRSSMVGSGKLAWPRDPKERLAVQVELFRHLGRHDIDVIDFCMTFLWAGGRHDDNVSNFVDQLGRPFLRDLKRFLRKGYQVISQEAAGLETLPQKAEAMADPSKVFVVHGRDEPLRKSMFEFLRSVGLVPLEWSQAVALTGQGSPYIGDIITSAFSIAQAIVVLLSPDDEVRLCEDLWRDDEETSETKVLLQPRPNVLFEAGMAFGSKSDRTVLVEVAGVKRFSDIAGRHAIRLSNDPQRRLEFVNRLRSAGCAVDVVGTDWLTTGNFEVTRAGAHQIDKESRSAAGGEPSIRYVDINYPADIGLVGSFAKDGKTIRWCSDDRLARALDIEGWQLVHQRDKAGKSFVLKLRDQPHDQTLIWR
jgi:predicted nucleotide-binding protein